MFDNIDGNRDASQIGLDASNPVDFKTIYDAAMQMLFKISYRIVNDEAVYGYIWSVADNLRAGGAKLAFEVMMLMTRNIH